MKFIENVVIGNINGAETNLFSLESHLFAIDNEDWYANESDKGYCRCWNCFDCSDNKNTTEYCSMKENYEKE